MVALGFEGRRRLAEVELVIFVDEYRGLGDRHRHRPRAGRHGAHLVGKREENARDRQADEKARISPSLHDAAIWSVTI